MKHGERYRDHVGAMFGTAPQFYRHRASNLTLSGGYAHFVEMNNYKIIERCQDQREAELHSARLNYEMGCYGSYVPRTIGLDGV